MSQAFLIFGGVVFSVTLAANCYLWTKRGLMTGVKEKDQGDREGPEVGQQNNDE